jgi:hypothetical protein
MAIYARSWWLATGVLVALNVSSLLVLWPREQQSAPVPQLEVSAQSGQAQDVWAVELDTSLATGIRRVPLKLSF